MAENTKPSLSSNGASFILKAGKLKEKTPMCLVNELARFNRIQHQYRLTKEDGPPHKKTFTVMLKLGDSEYTACGTSIKKAQHNAALFALHETTYKHPPVKVEIGNGANWTPTVALNAYTMKVGLTPVYTVLQQPLYDPLSFNYFGQTRPVLPPFFPRTVPFKNLGMENYRPKIWHPNGEMSYVNADKQVIRRGMRMDLYKVCVKIQNMEFVAEGASMQGARHNAAKLALDWLKKNKIVGNDKAVMAGESGSNDNKSPISQVHELAAKYDLFATFDIVSEKGAPHIRVYVTRCRLSNEVEVMAEGTGKKASKTLAAERMLEVLKSFPPPPKQKGDRLRGKRRFGPSGRNLNGKGDGGKGRELDKESMESQNNKEVGLALGKSISYSNVGKEIVPGVLIVPSINSNSSSAAEGESKSISVNEEWEKLPVEDIVVSLETAKRQLQYLADVYGYDFHMTDLPKGHQNEYLSLIELNTEPKKICYGSGETLEKAQNQAAFEMLQIIAETGINVLKLKKTTSEEG